MLWGVSFINAIMATDRWLPAGAGNALAHGTRAAIIRHTFPYGHGDCHPYLLSVDLADIDRGPVTGSGEIQTAGKLGFKRPAYQGRLPTMWQRAGFI